MSLDMGLLLADLRRDEGLTLTAKKDSRGYEIGYGHNNAMVIEGQRWTLDQAEMALEDDVRFKLYQLDHQIPWWRDLADNAQRGLANMAYENGVAGVLEFPVMVACLQARDYLGAETAALDSEWARTEATMRAQRIAALYRSCA